MPSLTTENYVKAIHLICTDRDNRPASTGEIATAMGVSPGTVTSMLKTLSEAKLATYTPYEGVRLTDSGDALALRVIRRHRLIELFLVKTLGLSWDEVHEEAEHMEHAVSDRLVDRIEEYLDFPESDPHGDPIPKADGTVTEIQHTHRLIDLSTGQEFCLVRVLDQSADFLRYLSDSGLKIGTFAQVTANHAAAGVVTVKTKDGETTFGRDVAEKLLVDIG